MCNLAINRFSLTKFLPETSMTLGQFCAIFLTAVISRLSRQVSHCPGELPATSDPWRSTMTQPVSSQTDDDVQHRPSVMWQPAGCWSWLRQTEATVRRHRCLNYAAADWWPTPSGWVCRLLWNSSTDLAVNSNTNMSSFKQLTHCFPQRSTQKNILHRQQCPLQGRSSLLRNEASIQSRVHQLY